VTKASYPCRPLVDACMTNLVQGVSLFEPQTQTQWYRYLREHCSQEERLEVCAYLAVMAGHSAAWDSLGPAPDFLDPAAQLYARRCGIPYGASLKNRLQQLAAMPSSRVEAEFYRLLAEDLSRAVWALGGRMGVYRSLLPEIVHVLCQHQRPQKILDIGCFGGVASLVLAQCLHQSTVVGIDRVAGWVRFSTYLKESLSISQVQFLSADFRTFRWDEPFDVILWLHVGTPAVVSRGGPGPKGQTGEPGPKQKAPASMLLKWQPSWATRAMAGLLAPQGMAFLYERIRGPGELEAWIRAARVAELEVADLWVAQWKSLAEGSVLQQAPALLFRRGRSGPPSEKLAMVRRALWG
jgi:SAM-dependent methyltransferase